MGHALLHFILDFFSTHAASVSAQMQLRENKLSVFPETLKLFLLDVDPLSSFSSIINI